MTTEQVTYAAPYAAINSTSRGGELIVVLIVALAITLFSVAVRFYISNQEAKGRIPIYKDDIFCVLATVCNLPFDRAACQ
jgi:hypothetical protein